MRTRWNLDGLDTNAYADAKDHLSNACDLFIGRGGRARTQPRFAPRWTAAMLQENTKDRRDELRLVASEVLEHRMEHGLKLIKPPASTRNMLRQDALMVAAFGLVENETFEKNTTADALNDAIEREHRSDIALLKGAMIERLAKVMQVFVREGVQPFILADAKEDNPTTKDKDMTASASIDPNKFLTIDAAVKPVVDNMLNQMGLPTLTDIGNEIKTLQTAAARGASGLTITMGEGMKTKGSTDGSIPAGKSVAKKAKDVLGLTGKAADPFDFDVPCWEWDAPHPYVPAVDEAYQFNPAQVMTILMALVTNQRAWLYGDTGCGKTTVIEQIAARLCYPVVRVNLDSEITRMDLIGAKDIIVDPKTGNTITTFTEGVLPWAMQQPCIFLADELDFIRADVAYVFQRALEGNGLTLTEDGGRVINPHSGFRIIATGNTQGNGDETGRYQGAKPQSAAFLDRFTVWMKCEYMKPAQVSDMLIKRFPKIGAAAGILAKYAQEHWVAFTNAEILTPLSPRGLIACATTYTVYRAVMDDEKALKQAMKVTFADRANREDAASITGLLERVIKS